MKPTLEEVKEYFKDALEIKDIHDGKVLTLTKDLLNSVFISSFGNYCIMDRNMSYTYLWGTEKGYAEITKFKPKNDFKTITESLSELLEYKNTKYGKSALNPIDIFNGKTKVGQRLDDKISRVKNSDVLRKNDIADIIGYLILVCQENDWNNFDEFKD